MKPKRDHLLTTSAVAKILRISPDMVRYLERRGQLPAQRLTSSGRGGQRVFRLDDVERLAETRGIRAKLDSTEID